MKEKGNKHKKVPYVFLCISYDRFYKIKVKISTKPMFSNMIRLIISFKTTSMTLRSRKIRPGENFLFAIIFALFKAKNLFF